MCLRSFMSFLRSKNSLYSYIPFRVKSEFVVWVIPFCVADGNNCRLREVFRCGRSFCSTSAVINFSGTTQIFAPLYFSSSRTLPRPVVINQHCSAALSSVTVCVLYPLRKIGRKFAEKQRYVFPPVAQWGTRIGTVLKR